VDQQHQLAIDGDEPLRAPGGEPLLCIALPAGASDLRFSPETLALGLARDPSGALAVRGPLPPGELELSLHFLVPIDRAEPLFSHAMPLDVPLLSVLVADTGVAVETSRLHRRRPIRTPDRSYLHLEGFEIPAGEWVELRLRPLAARRALPGTAAAGIALAAAGLALAYLVAPLRPREAAALERPSAAASHAADEREAVLAAIHGIEEDFEIGKLSEADYREMRQALRAEAVSLLRVERAALAEPERAASPRACARCDARADADARFCSQCGAPLAEPARSAAVGASARSERPAESAAEEPPR
ncbi:MAG TPA: zinc ribbon domain-containing protein, partial [Myxococcota bacterium]|nr:zinc ribbon domain-containing protein [Myxococcota bacterium]